MTIAQGEPERDIFDLSHTIHCEFSFIYGLLFCGPDLLTVFNLLR